MVLVSYFYRHQIGWKSANESKKTLRWIDGFSTSNNSLDFPSRSQSSTFLESSIYGLFNYIFKNIFPALIWMEIHDELQSRPILRPSRTFKRPFLPLKMSQNSI